MLIKNFFKTIIMIFSMSTLAACSINPATGDRQFTALMSASQESSIGMDEHPKILARYGGVAANQELERYVRSVGAKLVPHTERKDVNYSFHLLDTPMVNAFAVPGGYLYVTRGLLALADNEAELAGVLAHEIGHITGRHSAERYSQSVLAGLGTMVLAAAVDKNSVTKAAQLGSELYLKSYSRTQEHQADELGVRYLTRAGYDPYAMSNFLIRLQRHTELQSVISENKKNGGSSIDYFSTHPQTEERIAQASAHAAVSHNGKSTAHNRDMYLKNIDGMIFGDSPRHGYVRGEKFIHPEMGFMFEVPRGYKISNQPSQIVAHSKNGAVALFDTATNKKKLSAVDYIANDWLKDQKVSNLELVNIDGKAGATAFFRGMLGGQEANIRVVAVSWGADNFYRFQLAYPSSLTDNELTELKRLTYSLKTLGAQDRKKYRPYKVGLYKARSGDDSQKLAARQPLDKYSLEWFLLINGMLRNEPLKAGETYKLVRD